MRQISLYILLAIAVVFTACDDESSNPALTEVASGFASTTSQIDEDSDDTLTINVALESFAPSAGTVTLNLTETKITSADYTTVPAATAGSVTLNVAEGDLYASFKVVPVDNSVLDGTKLLTFTLASASNSVILGEFNLSHTVTIGDDETTLAIFDFNGCTNNFATPAGFSNEVVPGNKTDRGWGCNDFGVGNTNCVDVSGFSGAAGTSNVWLVLDLNSVVQLNTGGVTIDPSELTKLTVKVQTYSRFGGAGTMRIKYSTDYSGSGNPEAANWTEDTDVQNQLPAGGSRVFREVTADLSGAAGASQVYIAFQYVGATTGNAASWRIDDLVILGEK